VDEQPSSVKSKKSATSVTAQRRPPYKIGKLELQLLFVPKPKGSKDEDMPKSMNACIREMRDAESLAARSWEGFLSQQGGDCPVSYTMLPPHELLFTDKELVLAPPLLQAPGFKTDRVS
jgi:hypothetical protein